MRVTFRAQFSQPIGKLNPAGWRAQKPLTVTVEIYQSKVKWYARGAFGTEFIRLGSGPTHGTMKDEVAANFENQLSPWKMFDTEGKPLDESLIQEDPDGKFHKVLPTHIASQNQIGMPGNQFRTVCGIEVGAAQIRSKRGEHQPDCPTCRTAWEQVKEEMRLKQK